MKVLEHFIPHHFNKIHQGFNFNLPSKDAYLNDLVSKFIGYRWENAPIVNADQLYEWAIEEVSSLWNEVQDLRPDLDENLLQELFENIPCEFPLHQVLI